MISVIMPARQEPYINNTIRSLYDNAVGEIEVIVILDGEAAEIDERAKVIFHPKPLGRRVCMNEAASIARGKYLLHIDAHCSMSPEWDIRLIESCDERTLVVSIISVMDEKTGKIKPKHNYTFVYLNENIVEKWWGKYKKLSDCGVAEETMAMTGCGWLIRKDYYWQLGGCDESIGELGHLGPEWALKVWCNDPDLQGKMLLRTDVYCGHVFACHSTKIQPYTPQKISDAEFKNRMVAIYGDRIGRLRDKFNPPVDGNKTDAVKSSETVRVEQVIEVKRDGVIDVIEVHKEYFPVERPDASTITYTDWRLLWQFICDKKVRRMVEFGPGLSTAILSRCGIQVCSYETHPALIRKFKAFMPDVTFKLWHGTQVVLLNRQYNLAFIDGPLGGENREFAYRSVAENNIKYVACHDSSRKADKVWIDQYFRGWKIVAENKLKTGLLILEKV